ncbi:MAG: UbiA family prenyltransferase [Cyclobacteriaceae bacterium]
MGFFYVLGSVIFKVYRLFQALSLDIAVGAVILSTAMAKYYGVSLTWPVQLCLFIAVWLIYTFDHLMDGERALQDQLSYRHLIHRCYRKQIVYSSIMSILVGTGSIFLLPTQVILWGVTAAAFIVIYFILVRFTVFWAKEVFVALGYTAGVFLAPMALLPQWPNTGELWLVVGVFLVALVNLLLFSLYDYQLDKQNGFHSLAIQLGAETTKGVIGILLTITSLLIGWMLINHPSDLMFWILLMMTTSLVAIHLRPTVFQRRDNYRILGDGIFFLPLFYLIYA